MTLIIGWIGKDSRKISSFYLASDSRFSWRNPLKYDYGRKVFALSNSPDILGYCGDVLYPTLILNQILEMDRDKILFPRGATNIERSKIIFRELTKKFDGYPSQEVMRDSLDVIHVSRQGETDFLCNVYHWTKDIGWEIRPQQLPTISDKVVILGSGRDEFWERYLTYFKALNGKTSRALFQCLTHSLLKIKDLECGGPPQLVGLYNRFNGKNFGVIYEGKRYYLGKEVESGTMVNNIEWRNDLFERCNGETAMRLDGAQRQPDELRP